MVSINTMPLGWRHIWITFVASLGQMIGTALATVVGIVIPLVQLTGTTHLDAFEQGILGCVSLLGIMVGASVLGRLSDTIGYIWLFRICPTIVLLAVIAGWAIDSVLWAGICFFIMGFGVGGEYSLDSDYISELMPDKWRNFMVGVAKACCSFGGILAALAAFIYLRIEPHAYDWNNLLLIIGAIALLMILVRIRFWESPRWLLEHGKPEQAEIAAQHFLGKDVTIFPPGCNPSDPTAKACTTLGKYLETAEIRNRGHKEGTPETSFWSLFHGENLKRVIATGIPWACEGLGVYGIGTFLPLLVLALGIEKLLTSSEPGVSASIEHVIVSVEITAFINFFILPGFLIGLWMLKRVYGITILTQGFIWSGIGLLILLAGYAWGLPLWVSLTGFAVFEIFQSLGPHLMTYVLPSEVYPVIDRGEGAGVAASLGKVGAATAVFVIPALLHWGGMDLVLWVSIAVQYIGAFFAFVFGREVLPKSSTTPTTKSSN